MRTERKFRWRWPGLALATILMIWALVYFRGGRRLPLDASKSEGSAPPSVSPLVEGRQVFFARCVACHQMNGRGLPGIYPPLAGSEWLTGSDDRIIRIVLNGMSGPAEINGEKFNNLMIPFREILSDEQIADVLTYVRQEWGNSAKSVAAEKVAGIRNAIAGRGAAWTATELLLIP